MQYCLSGMESVNVSHVFFSPGKVMNQESVNLYKFVLFLSLQQLYRMSLRTSLVAGDEYPCLVMYRNHR